MSAAFSLERLTEAHEKMQKAADAIPCNAIISDPVNYAQFRRSLPTVEANGPLDFAALPVCVYRTGDERDELVDRFGKVFDLALGRIVTKE